jgi:hypothetical protein
VGWVDQQPSGKIVYVEKPIEIVKEIPGPERATHIDRLIEVEKVVHQGHPQINQLTELLAVPDEITVNNYSELIQEVLNGTVDLNQLNSTQKDVIKQYLRKDRVLGK